MIIAFYPGGGGNRYLRMLENEEWQKFNQSYDFSVFGQAFKNRYLLDGVDNTDQSYILTHCLNTSHLKKSFPGRKIVFIIGDLKSCLRREWGLAGHLRFVKSEQSKKINFDRLQHYYGFKDQSWPDCKSADEIDRLSKTILQEIDEDYKKNFKEISTGVDKVKQNVLSKVDSSFENIVWHKNYYEQYPIEIDADAEVVDISSGSSKFCQVMRQELSNYHSEIFDQVWHSIYE
jgi:hypothetical protein